MTQEHTKVLQQNFSSKFVLLCLEGLISGLESESRKHFSSIFVKLKTVSILGEKDSVS